MKDLLFMLMGLAGLTAAGLFYVYKRPADSKRGLIPTSIQRRVPLTSWAPPAKAAPYMPAFIQAEDANDLPRYLLARMAQQESNFDPDARGAAGEIGILQIIPRFHPNANPRDPFDSIRYAGALMREHFDRFGSWSSALAAYNWGPTALATRGFTSAPSSTRAYIAAITDDVGIA